MDRSQEQPPPRPGWVRWSIVVVALLALVALVLVLFLPGEHGPGRHM